MMVAGTADEADDEVSLRAGGVRQFQGQPSGKSHYIGVLVQRLMGQVGSDLGASLRHVTDNTFERYRTEFYDPLFNQRRRLPATAGVPPPLMYSLALGRQ